MQTRILGNSTLNVSVIGLGCNNFGRAGTATETQAGTNAVIVEALDAGVTLFDTADIYGGSPGESETLMGFALRGRRDDAILATKFGHEAIDMGIASGAPKGTRRYIRAAVADSLRRLQTDRIDLYQMHTPDPVTPIETTIAALEELVLEGKIRFFGHTQFTPAQIREADAAAVSMGIQGFVSAQDEYSLLARAVENEVLPVVTELGLGFLPFFPLHNGLLTGKFTRTDWPKDTRIMRQRAHIAENAPWDTLERFENFCADRSVPMLAATLGWLLAQPAITSVIAGATLPQQVRQNVATVAAWAPTEEDIATIAEIFA